MQREIRLKIRHIFITICAAISSGMEIDMKIKIAHFVIFLAFALYLGACGNQINEIDMSSWTIQNVQGTQDPEGSELQSGASESGNEEQEKAEQEKAKQERIQQEERRSHLVTAFIGKFPLEEEGEGRDAFVEWLLDTYSLEQLETIDFSEDMNKQLYNVTGKSFHVLWDTCFGYLADENTAATHSIYFRDCTEDTVVDLAFAGDICLTEDGFVIDHYDEIGGDISLCLSKEILDRFHEADISMINHEYPASTRGKALERKLYTFRAAPERELILQQMSIDIVSLANNHIFDYGEDALYDTLESLNQLGIPYVGAGENIAEAAKPVFFVTGGIKIGFVAANRSEVNIRTPEAGDDSPGVVRMYDTTMMNEIIRDVSGQCDYLIAYVHWGTEGSKYFESYQKEIAREFFDSGADAIIGAHPHVLQGMELVDGKPVIYSLGNFWFNGKTAYTTIANLKVTIDGLEELSFLPCIQEGYETRYIVDDAGQNSFYEYLRKLSPGIRIDENGVVSAAIF